jgi:hypothetical protein
MLTQVPGSMRVRADRIARFDQGQRRAADLATQHRDLVTQDQDLSVFGRGPAREQPQPAQQPDRDQVQQSKPHGPRSCHDHMVSTNTRSPHVARFGTAQDRLSCVRFGSDRYSVPTRLIGSTVELCVGQGRMLVVEPATSAVVADHGLVAPGEASVLDEYHGGPRPSVPARAVRPKTVA